MENDKSQGSGVIKNIIIILIVMTLIGSILFFVYQSKQTNNNGGLNISNTLNTDVLPPEPPNVNTVPVQPNNSLNNVQVQPNNPNQQITNSVDLQQNGNLTQAQIIQKAKEQILIDNNLVPVNSNNDTKYIVIIVIIILVFCGIFYWYFIRKNDDDKSLKQPVPINKIKRLFRERISKDYGLSWYYNEDKEFKLSSDRDFYFKDQRVFFDKQSGDKFLVIEFIINDGPSLGVHIALIPADKGEKILEEGEWTIIHSKDLDTFKLMKARYPMSSIADKQERKEMFIAEQIASGNIDKNTIDNFKNDNERGNDFNKDFSSNSNIINRTGFNSPFGKSDDDDGDDDNEFDQENPRPKTFRSGGSSRRNYKGRYRR